jgi:APA family basic amino acid/polyamine antiporter
MTEPAAASDAPHFKKGISLIDLVTLGAGTAIGSSVFTVMGPAAKVAGSGMVISLLIAALPMVIFGVVYAYMASAVPKTAATFEWQRDYTSPVVAFGVVWMRILSNAVVMTIYAQILVKYGSMVVDLPVKPTMFVLFAIIFGLNYFGVAVAARAQTILMFGLLAVFALLVALAAPSIKPQIFVDAVSGGWTPILAALPLMISLFLGIEAATEVGDEVKDPSRNVPLGLILAMILTAVVYLAICLASLGLIGPKALADSDAPLVAAGQVVLGGLAKPLIVTAAVLALLKSMNAVFLVYSRFLYAMGKAGQLPTALGNVHPRWGTPHVATFVAFLLSCSGLLLPSSLLFLLLAVSVPTMAKYFGSCLAAYSVARNHPEVHDKARIKLSRPTVKTLAVVGMIAAVVIASLGVGTDIRPYYLLGGWLVLGLAYYYGWVRRRGHA